LTIKDSVEKRAEHLPAADEVDDFQAVFVLQRGGGPLVAPHDLAIQLYRDPVAGKLKVAEQLREIEWCRNLPVFSVDDEFHLRSVKAADHANRATAPWRPSCAKAVDGRSPFDFAHGPERESKGDSDESIAVRAADVKLGYLSAAGAVGADQQRSIEQFGGPGQPDLRSAVGLRP
jgi:hypothetical protein